MRDAVTDIQRTLPLISKDTAVNALNRIWSGLRYGQYAKRAKLDMNKFAVLTILAEREADAEGLLRRLGELRSIIQEHRNRPDNRFTLSTIHSSKGLEYERVYLFDVFDGILPSLIPDSDASIEDMKLYEEERRLYYVAMTRAKRELYLFSCDRPSSFTREIMSGLPLEIIDANDVFSPFRQNLCGKTYTDQRQGKGTITAQCGDTVLVEYDGGRTDLLSLEEMFHSRDRTVHYAPPVVRESPSTVPQNLEEKPAIPQEIQETAVPHNRPELSCGMEVVHKKFGKGEVVAVSSDILQVYFPERSETKRFVLDMMFRNRLLTVVS